MSKQTTQLSRRRFLESTAAGVAAAPMFIPSTALGRDGAVAPSERIVVGGIGIGRRGGYDLGCFLQQKDVQFVAVADVKRKRRGEVKQIVDKHNGTEVPGLLIGIDAEALVVQKQDGTLVAVPRADVYQLLVSR